MAFRASQDGFVQDVGKILRNAAVPKKGGGLTELKKLLKAKVTGFTDDSQNQSRLDILKTLAAKFVTDSKYKSAKALLLELCNTDEYKTVLEDKTLDHKIVFTDKKGLKQCLGTVHTALGLDTAASAARLQQAPEPPPRSTKHNPDERVSIYEVPVKASNPNSRGEPLPAIPEPMGTFVTGPDGIRRLVLPE